MIEEEYHRTVEAVLRISGGRQLAERFPRFRRKLARRMPTLNQVGRQQIELLRRFRESGRGSDAGRAALGAAAVDQRDCGGVRGDRLKSGNVTLSAAKGAMSSGPFAALRVTALRFQSFHTLSAPALRFLSTSTLS